MKMGILVGVFFTVLVTGSATVARARVTEAPVTCDKCHADKVTAPYSHYPAESLNCDICHDAKPQHLETGDKDYVRTDYSRDVCYACHDRKDDKKYPHTALDACSACHSPHGSNLKFMLKDKVGPVCFTCHDSSMAHNKSVHGPVVSEESCMSCHRPHSSDRKKLLRQDPDANCMTCHDKEIQGKERVIPNIKEKLDSPSQHMPAAECTSCHSPHSSKYDRLLISNFAVTTYARYVKNTTYELCFTCHDEKMLSYRIEGKETNFRHDKKNGSFIDRTNLHWIHVTNGSGTTGPDRGRSCKVCHDPHGARQDHMIRDKVAGGRAPMIFKATQIGGECTKSCHGPRSYQRLD